MNKGNAKDYLPLVQALADGKVIQHEWDGVWKDCTDPYFDFPANTYRIKPEPRKVYLVWLENVGTPFAFTYLDDAEGFVRAKGGHITEVTE